MAKDHPNYTCFADRVVFYDANGVQFVGFVTGTYQDNPHIADLGVMCPHTFEWHGEKAVPFGESGPDGRYFTNPEA